MTQQQPFHAGSTERQAELLRTLTRIARAAGAEILAIYQRGFSAVAKGDGSPLTEADTAAHRLISRALAGLPERIPILSEEDVGAFDGADARGRYWLVDPLDGTKEFIARNGEFTVNIALIEQGAPVLGVVYAPVPDLLWCAAAGLGAFKQDAQGVETRLQPGQRYDGSGPLRILCSRSHPDAAVEAWLDARLPEARRERLQVGSSLKFCLLAEGKADLYPRLGPTSLWDTAAGQMVLEAAGGQVVKEDGQPLRYGNTAQLINPAFFAHALKPDDWQRLAQPRGAV